MSERRDIGPGVLAGLRLSLWHVRYSFRLLAAVSFGMLMAVTLICTVPLYSNLVSNVGLQQQLSIQLPQSINVEADTALHPANPSTVGAVLDQTASLAREHIGRFAPASSWYMQVNNIFPILAVNNLPIPNLTYPMPMNPVMQPYVFNLPSALPHMDILSGRLPEPTAAGEPPEVLILKNMGLQPGAIISMQFGALKVRVVGIWTPKNTSDPYWNGTGLTFDPFFPPCIKNCPPAVFPVVFEQNMFFALFGGTPSAVSSTAQAISVHYISYTVPTQITVSSIPAVVSAIAMYRSKLNGTLFTITGVTGIGVATQLDTVLKGQQLQFNLLAQPLYIVLLELVGLTLLFVIAMAATLVESQASEIATLKSRGAGRAQLLLSYSLQGLLAAIPAALAGSFLAVALSLAIIRFFVPDAGAILRHQTLTSSGVVAEVVSPQMVLLPALAGASLSLVAVVLAAWIAGRRDVLVLRREAGRQAHAPFWQRYYLDLGLAVLAIAGYLELGEFGGLNIRQQLGDSSLVHGGDPLQLVAPALLLFAAALVALRLFPLATWAGARLARAARGATGMLAFAQLARAGTQFARLALLLTLAVGLGVFALTFQASLVSNTRAEAKFLVGCDQRIILQSPVEGTPPTAPFQAAIAAMPGVNAISPIYRSIATNALDDTNVDILGIDPATFAQVAYWRSDYASEPLAKLLHEMQAHTQGPEAGNQSHPIWALIDPQFAATYHLAPGVTFGLIPQDSSSVTLFFTVGAVVSNFPTLGDSSVAGHVIFNLADYASALKGPQGGGGFINYIGPNEYWLRVTSNASAAAARARDLENPNLWVDSAISLKAVEQQAMANPLASGMAGLLLTGAVIAAILAVLGSVIQSSVAARQRVTQFAILRTLGGKRPQLAAILLAQQVVVYGFGLAAGTVLGIVLATATLPFLQFSTAALNITTQQLPAFLLSFNMVAIAGFYVALLVAFAVALAAGLREALRSGLGQTLRMGED